VTLCTRRLKVLIARKFARCVTNNDLNLHLVIYTKRLMHACQVFHMQSVPQTVNIAEIYIMKKSYKIELANVL
jgi:3-isopropylmalate dehydratase small subunit